MPITRDRFGPSGPFSNPDGGTNNGLPSAMLRCEAAGDATLTDSSGAQVVEFTPNNGSIVVPEDSVAGPAIGNVLDVRCEFLNRKGLTTTNPRVDITVEVYNSTTATWVGAGSAIDVDFAQDEDAEAVVVGNPSTGVTAGTYTKARLTLAANAANSANNNLAGFLAADNPRIDIALYQGVA